MKNNGKAMVMASFLADSLALGAHWIYDTESIPQEWVSELREKKQITELLEKFI